MNFICNHLEEHRITEKCLWTVPIMKMWCQRVALHKIIAISVSFNSLKKYHHEIIQEVSECFTCSDNLNGTVLIKHI